jgi:hypothetical protein
MEEETLMFKFLNPFKQTWNALCLTLFCLVMSYTHSQAFKMGVTVHQNPLLEKTAQILGILPDSPPKPERNEVSPLLSDILGWLEEATPDQP